MANSLPCIDSDAQVLEPRDLTDGVAPKRLRAQGDGRAFPRAQPLSPL